MSFPPIRDSIQSLLSDIARRVRILEAQRGGGIDFETIPQDGDWLYVETTGPDTIPSGTAEGRSMAFIDNSPTGGMLQTGMLFASTAGEQHKHGGPTAGGAEELFTFFDVALEEGTGDTYGIMALTGNGDGTANFTVVTNDNGVSGGFPDINLNAGGDNGSGDVNITAGQDASVNVFRDINLNANTGDINESAGNDLNLSAGNDLNIIGPSIGFFNGGPTTQPTITGSRGGNAALASLLTALDAMGLIIDATSA
jgi:hypothetical protein